MTPTILKIVGTVLGAGLIALGHSGLVPIVPPEVFSSIAALIFGALHIETPPSRARIKRAKAMAARVKASPLAAVE